MSEAYKDHCLLTCTDNGKEMPAEILDHRPERSLSVSVGRSVKLEMRWDNTTQIYVGNSAGLEFTTTGPESLGFTRFKR